VHPLGEGMIALSKDAILHAYDKHLKLAFETALGTSPEIVALRKRFEIGDDELKNHIRCVALSQNAERYLFTAVDEAWCVSRGGQSIWGAKLPLKEGWTRVTATSANFGTTEEVDSALGVLGLALPVTPTDVKRRYRELAMEWHPDRNVGKPEAELMMKEINAAAETLSGIDGNVFSSYSESRYERVMSKSRVDIAGLKFDLTVQMQVGEKYAADWIYATAFAAKSDGVYLAGYSGRVVLVDDRGKGIRVYDIGSVPRQIVDTGSFLYILTDTRLYVLKENALFALVDMFDAGELVVAENGFGLLEKKRLRWYRSDGTYSGSVVSKDPIRRVYYAAQELVVETRKNRAIVQGAPSWW
jgi:DnaJ-domain-containing protein 1